MRLNPLSVVLLLSVLTSGQVGAQDSEIVTVTGLHVDFSGGEYEETLSPCDTHEVWDVVANGPAFATLTQAYASAETSG